MNLLTRNHPRLVYLGFVFAMCIGFPRLSQAADCALVAQFLTIKKQIPSSADSMNAWSIHQKNLWIEMTRISENIFSRYIKGNWNTSDSTTLANCLTKDEIQNLQAELNRTFWKRSIESFKSKPGILESFGSHLELEQFQQYHITGYFSPSPEEGKAGFHRGIRSVFMDFSRIPPNEWLIIFAHEMSHAMDKTLAEGTETYSDQQLVNVMADWAHKTENSKTMPPEVQIQLSTWLKAGLDRGFLAEYRAWYLTARIYLEGLKYNLWQKIGWLDEILSLRKPNESLASLIFRYLDDKFADPTDGMFSLKLIKNSLADKRSSLRANPPPPIGNLQDVLDNRSSR